MKKKMMTMVSGFALLLTAVALTSATPKDDEY